MIRMCGGSSIDPHLGRDPLDHGALPIAEIERRAEPLKTLGQIVQELGFPSRELVGLLARGV